MYIQLVVTLLGLVSTAVATYSPEQLNNLRAAHDRLVASPTTTTTMMQAPRQVSYATLAPSCASSALAIVDAMPYATGALALFLDSFDAATDPTNLCAVTAALPASLRGPYSALDRQASAWYATNSAGIQRLLTSCGNAALGAQLTRAVAALQAYTARGCEGDLATPTLSLVLSAAPTASSAGAVVATMVGFVGGLPPNTTTPFTSSSSSSTSTTTNITTSTDSATAAAASATTSSISQDAAVRPTGVLAGAMAAAGLLGAVMML
ncbi:hypothetical protein F5X96DRAFT_680752 [Biscogniauxia mediterranea]|nr:hypothetical protein F5X96DRAFT_680752 [Biscogniauxia mediterranea]